MADLTLVQGVADLRLSDRTLRRDLEQARRLILNTVRAVERDQVLTMRFRIDEDQAVDEIVRFSTTIADLIEPISVPVRLDTDAALGDAAALVDLVADTVSSIPVQLDTDAALGDAAALVDLVGETLTVQVAADTTEARNDIVRLGTDILQEQLTLPFQAEVDQTELERLASELDAATSGFGDRLRRSDFDAFRIPLTADSTALNQAINRAEDVAVDPITVPLRFDYGEDLAVLSQRIDDAFNATGARRIRAVTELDTTATEVPEFDVTQQRSTVEIVVTADTAPALAAIAAIGDVAPITVPVIIERPGEITAPVDVAVGGVSAQALTITDVPDLVIDVTADTSAARAAILALGDLDAITVRVDADTTAVDAAANRIESIAPPTVPVGVYSDLADAIDATLGGFGDRLRDRKFTGRGALYQPVTSTLDQLLAAQDVEIPARIVPDKQQLDQALAEIPDQVEPIRAPFVPDADTLAQRLAQIPQVLDAVTVPVQGDFEPLRRGAAAVDDVVPDTVTTTFQADTTSITAAADRLDNLDDTITFTVEGDFTSVLAGARAVENVLPRSTTLTFDGDPGPVRADIDDISLQIEQLKARARDLRFGGGGDGGPIDTGGLIPVLPPEDFARAGDAAGRTFGQSVLAAARGIITTGAVTLGGFLSLSLVRGFQRLTTIRDSVASLTVQLGSATRAATLLDEVLEVVTGTPFNLDQFAEAASNLVAFGVEAEKIPGYLTAISEVAATRGGRANEYAQRLAITFGQIAVAGRITNDEINQLSLTGVPALQILGNAFGETTFNIREMISQGLVPADQALDALTTGILEGSQGINGATVAFAGTAEALRETLTGSIGGFRAATARFGVNIIEPIEDTLIAGFTGASKALDTLGKTFRDNLRLLSVSDEVIALRGFLGELPEFASDAADSLRQLGPAFAPLAAVIGGLGLGQLANLLGPLGNFLPGITGPIGAITVAVTSLIATTPELRDEFVPVLQQLGTTIIEVGAIIGPALTDLAEASIPVLLKLADILDDLLPIIGDGAVAAASVIGQLASGVELLGRALGAVPTGVLTALGAFFIAYKAFGTLSGPGPLGGLTGQLSQLQRAQQLTAAGFATTQVQAGLTARSLNRVGVSAEAMGKVGSAATIAITAGLSGMGLAADDTSTKITGLTGAVASIGLGAATFGAPGAALAALGVGIGYIAGEFIEARREAEAFARAVTASTDEIVGELTEVQIAAGNISFDDFDLRSDERLTADFVAALGDDLNAQLAQIPGFDINDLFNFDENNVDLAVGLLKDLRGEAENLAREVDDFDLDLFGRIGTDPAGLIRTSFESVAAAFGQFRDASEPVESFIERIASSDETTFRQINEAIASAEEYNGLIARRAQIQEQLAEIGVLNVPDDVPGIQALIEVLSRYGTATEEIRASLEADLQAATKVQQLREGFFRRELELRNVTVGLIDDILAAARRLDDTEPSDLVDIGALQGYGVAAAIVNNEIEKAKGNLEETPPLIYDAEAASEAWANALAGVTSALDGASSVLDGISARVDLASAVRGLGESLGEIVNESELRKAEQIGDQIDRQLERVRDAADRLAEEQLEFSFNEQIALANIAEAEAAGAFKGAIAARRDLERDRLEVQQLADDLAEEEGKLAELQAQAAEFGSVAAVTFGDVIRQQANELFGGSLVDLLFSGATDESGQLFSQVEGIIRPALSEISRLISEGDLDGAAQYAENARSDIEAELTRQFGSGSAQRILAELFDLDDTIVELGAIDDVRTYVGAVQDGLDAEEAFQLSTNLSDEDFAAGEAVTYYETVQALLTDNEFTAAVGLDPASAAVMVEELRAALSTQVFDLIPGLVTVNGLGEVLRTGSGPGGGFTALAKGGLLEGTDAPHVAQIAHGFRLWAEPETGGEAYIPLTVDPVQRRRSEKIMADVADRFGMALFGVAGEPLTARSTDLVTQVIERFAQVSRETSAERRMFATDRMTPVVADIPDRFGPIHVTSTASSPTVAVAVAAPDLDGLADAVAAGVGRAMVRTQKAQIARDYAEAVHIEHLHVGGDGNDRRTARRVVRELADLSLRRLR